MPHALRLALFVCLLLPATAGATPVLVEISGFVSFVSDRFGMLDGSILDGSEPGDPPPPPTELREATYQLDPTSSSSSTPFGVGLGQLSFKLGSYEFSASDAAHAIALENDTGAPGFELDRWRSRAIVLSDLTPGTSNQPVGFGGFAASIEFYDFQRTVFDGTESAVFLPGAITPPWDQVRLTLNSITSSGAFDGRVQIDVEITGWQVTPVPEPQSAILVALGLVSIAARRRSILRSR